MTVKLSICIPTYNRGKFLRELLASIASQSLDHVEVVVSDNASSDDTGQVLQEFASKINRLVVHRWDSNVGADRNYLKVVECANGEYCWLMGSDDIVPYESIAKIIDILNYSADITLIGRNMSTIDLIPRGTEKFLDENVQTRKFDFSKKKELITYLQACRSLGGVFSYLSSIVVKRASWQAIDFDEKFIGTAYSHVYILMAICLKNATVFYTPEPLVTFRGGNDSFKTNLLARGLLDLRGYAQLADALIADALVKKEFLQVMRYQHSWLSIIKMMGSCTDKTLLREYLELAPKFGISVWKLQLAKVLQPFAHIAYRMKYEYLNR